MNEGLALTVRINDIEEVEMASETNTLLIVDCDKTTIDLLIGLNIYQLQLTEKIKY